MRQTCSRKPAFFILVLALSIGTAHAAIAQGADTAAPRAVSTEGAPKAIGPYSQAIAAGGFLFTAGQIGRDPATGKAVEGDIVAQTNRVFDNLEAVLKAGGCSLADVVKVTVYLTDLGDFEKMNAAYAKRFGDTRPARSTVQVAKLPGGSPIEIDFVARIPEPAKKKSN